MNSNRQEYLTLLLSALDRECEEAVHNLNNICKQANQTVEAMKNGKTTDSATYWQFYEEVCELVQTKTSMVRRFNVAQAERVIVIPAPASSVAGTPKKTFGDLVSSINEVNIEPNQADFNKGMYATPEPHRKPDIKTTNGLSVSVYKSDETSTKNINTILKGDGGKPTKVLPTKPIVNKCMDTLNNEKKNKIEMAIKKLNDEEHISLNNQIDMPKDKNTYTSQRFTESPKYKPHCKIPDAVHIVIGKETSVKILQVLSPLEFYVSVGHPKDIEIAENRLKKLNSFYLGFCGNEFPDKESAKSRIRNAICVVKHSSVWKRIKVFDWKLEPRMNDLVGVKFCDYGGTDYVRYYGLRELNPEFADIPQQATKCYLYNLKPVDGSWNIEAINCLKSIKEALVIAREVKRLGYGVEIIHDTQNVNKSLVMKRYADFVTKTSSNENNELSNTSSSNNSLENECAPVLETKVFNKRPITVGKCRLSEEEVKALDACVMSPDEGITDPCVAVMGYAPQDEKNICKFFNRPEGCFKKNCGKAHAVINPNGWTRDQTPINNYVLPTIIFPNAGEELSVRVTHVADFNVFFGTVLKPNISRGFNGRQMLNYRTATELGLFMNRADVSARLKPLKFLPAPTELVIARYSEDSLFYRARVLDILENGFLQIEYVDYGNTARVKEADLRQLTEEFTEIPFQATQFIISNVSVIRYTKPNLESMEKIRKVLLHKTVNCLIVKIEDNAVEVIVKDSNGFDISSFLTALKVVLPKQNKAISNANF